MHRLYIGEPRGSETRAAALDRAKLRTAMDEEGYVSGEEVKAEASLRWPGGADRPRQHLGSHLSGLSDPAAHRTAAPHHPTDLMPAYPTRTS